MTNGDRIRQMTDAELAAYAVQFISDFIREVPDGILNSGIPSDARDGMFLMAAFHLDEWTGFLKQEVNGND